MAAKSSYFGLRFIAYLRTGLPTNDEDLTEATLVDFARWQICKARNILWNDPVWDSYTKQEILIEYFAIRFDEDDKARRDFEVNLVTAKKRDLDWFDAMEAKILAERAAQNDKIKEVKVKIEEFEDTFK